MELECLPAAAPEKPLKQRIAQLINHNVDRLASAELGDHGDLGEYAATRRLQSMQTLLQLRELIVEMD